MTTVYQPPHKHSHSAELPTHGYTQDLGQIMKCSCNKYFYLGYIDRNAGSKRYGTTGWFEVRWYMWGKRKLIKEWEANNDPRR